MSRSGTGGGQAPQVTRAFEVTHELTPAQVSRLRSQYQGDLTKLIPLRAGWIGIVPVVSANFDSNDQPREFLQVQLLRYSTSGAVSKINTGFQNGWALVPKGNIKIGQQTKSMNEWPVVSNVVLGHPTLAIDPNHEKTNFTQFLSSFLTTLTTPQNLEFMKSVGVPDEMMEAITGSENRNTFINSFLDGMAQCETLDAFTNGIPSMRNIWFNFGHIPVSESDVPQRFRRLDGVYIYIIMYYCVRNHFSEHNGLYSGSSIHPIVRWRNHRGQLILENPMVSHHRNGRALAVVHGAQYRMFPLLFLPRTAKNFKFARAWSETIALVLFETFNPKRSSNNQTPMTAAGRANTLPTGDPDTVSSPLVKFLMDVAQSLKRDQQRFQNFKPDFKFSGFNWTVPLLEPAGYDGSLWVKTPILRENGQPYMYQFTTYPRRFSELVERNVRIFYARQGERGGWPKKLILTLTKDEFPEIGDKTYFNIVAEVMANDEPHPYPWLQIPDVGPFDQWNQASRLAFKAEFQFEDGTWGSKYLQRPWLSAFKESQPSREMGNQPAWVLNVLEHVEINWLHAMKAIAALMRWDYPADHPLAKQFFNRYNAKVVTFKPQFLDQRVVISDPGFTKRALPLLRTLDETADIIEAHHGHDVTIGYFPGPELVWFDGPGGGQSARRTACDQCIRRVQHEDERGALSRLFRDCGKRVVIAQRGGQNMLQCKACYLLRRFCTFTPNILGRTDLYGLIYQVRDPFPRRNISGPSNAFQLLEQREMTVFDEDEEDNEGHS